MLNSHIHNAEFFIQSSKHLSRDQKQSVNPTSKWRSIYSKLKDVFLEGTDDGSESGKPELSLKKQLCLLENPLEKLCRKDESINRIVINLFPLENGYSIMFKNSNKQHFETIQLPYDEYEILNFVDNAQIPPLLIEALSDRNEDVFYFGCIVAEIRDYRIAASVVHFETRYVLLQPTYQTLLGDVNAIAAETSHLYRWGTDEKLALESYLLLATSDPLCLDPSPTVQVMKNLQEDQRKPFKRHAIKRCLHRNGISAMRRSREQSSEPTPDSLQSFDVVQKLRSKKNEQTNSTSCIRLPKNALDLWRRPPLDVSTSATPSDVMKYAKALQPKPKGISNYDLLEIQQIHLKSESQNRDVYSIITIYQRPSDMQYYGKLQSNKYFQQPLETGPTVGDSCRFSLGTEQRANLYILQYQELFAEDGRRPATVTVTRALQPNSTKYQIPLQNQPWQLEQDKSLYAVGSVNSIPVQHWAKLKVKVKQLKPPVMTNQHLSSNPGQRSYTSNGQPVASNTNPQVNSAITTPTLNTVTLQPSTQQSAFVFPIPRQMGQQNGFASQSPHPTQGHNVNPAGPRALERRVSSETISLLTGADGGVYQIQESPQSGKRSRQGSAHDVFSLVPQSGNQATNSAGTGGTPLATPTLVEGNNSFANASRDVVTQNAISQGGGSISLQLPLTNLQGQQHQHTVIPQGSVQLHNKGITLQNQQVNRQQQPGAIIRMPVSISGTNPTDGQQISSTISLLGARNSSSQASILSNIQQIQLTSGSRVPGGTVTIPADQFPAGIAMQLAAAANQLNQDKGSSSASGTQHFTIATSSSSGPFTIVTNNNSTNVGTPQQQQQQLRAVASNSRQQQQTFVQSSDGQAQSATLTFNPRTQMLTASVRGSNVQRPVQLVQVGSNATIHQLPIRIPGQQLMINPARSTTADHSNSPQMTLTQHLQQLSANTTASGGAKRGRKRKNTPS